MTFRKVQRPKALGLSNKVGIRTPKASVRPKSASRSVSKLKKILWALCREIALKSQINPSGYTCYTCGATGLEGSNRQLGHFIPKSICSTELAYDLDNLRWQCSACNIWKSGNWVAFEAHLILEKGRDFPDTLKKRNQETKGKSYGRQWYESKITEYTELLITLPPTP